MFFKPIPDGISNWMTPKKISPKSGISLRRQNIFGTWRQISPAVLIFCAVIGIIAAYEAAIPPNLAAQISQDNFADIIRDPNLPWQVEADEINYVSRVQIPVLMLNGRFDYYFPLETNVQPMFELLGTAEEDKTLKIYDTPHIIPKNELIKESLNWLDRYFGPVHN